MVIFVHLLSFILPGNIQPEIFFSSFGLTGNRCEALPWIMASIIITIFPIRAVKLDRASIFFFFALTMALQLLWVIFKMPKTKGVPLEEPEAKLIKRKIPVT